MIKNCENCSGKFKGCFIKDYIKIDIETDAECLLEEGTFESILQEQINPTDLFLHMQEKGIIKKNVNIKEISQDDDIIFLITETVSDAIWDAFRRQAKQLKPKFEMNTGYDFHCSAWR